MDFLDAEGLQILPPRGALRGRVRLPGSKSVTNRALLIAALANGRSTLSGVLKSDDTRYMAAALRSMGVMIAESDAGHFVVDGRGSLTPPGRPLFLGNAGTATRFLAAAAALVGHPVIIDGDAHMRRRPIQPLLDALRGWGIDAASPTGCPPVTIHGHGLKGGRLEIDGGLSSQFVSALMMIAPLAANPVEIALKDGDVGARGYITLTADTMRMFGANIEERGDRWLIMPTGYRPREFAIAPDASAATYFWAAEALTAGAIETGWISSDRSQPDAAAHPIIAAFPNMPDEIDGSQFQDAIPTLAALAAFNHRPVRFHGIENLRVKECDRIAAMATELNRVEPALAREEGDELIVAGQPALAGETRSVRIETYHDHRIAMAMMLVGLRVSGLVINDPGCTAKTFPGYWDAMRSLGVGLVPDRPARIERLP